MRTYIGSVCIFPSRKCFLSLSSYVVYVHKTNKIVCFIYIYISSDHSVLCWITIGCLSPNNMFGNLGKHGTSCSSFECICISETSQPFWHAFTQVCHSFVGLDNLPFSILEHCKVWFKMRSNICFLTGITN